MKRNMRTRLISSVLGEQRREAKSRQEQLEEAERARQIQSERKSWWSLAGQAVGALWGPAGVLIGMGVGKAIGDLATVGGKQAESYKVSTDTGAWGGTEESAMVSKINKKLADVDKSEMGKDILDIGKKAASLYGASAMKAMKNKDWSEFSLTKWGGGKSGLDIVKEKWKDMFGKEDVLEKAVSKGLDPTKIFKQGELLQMPDVSYDIETGEGFVTKMKRLAGEQIDPGGLDLPGLETIKENFYENRFGDLAPSIIPEESITGATTALGTRDFAKEFQIFEDKIAAELLDKKYDFPDPSLLEKGKQSPGLIKAREDITAYKEAFDDPLHAEKLRAAGPDYWKGPPSSVDPDYQPDIPFVADTGVSETYLPRDASLFGDESMTYGQPSVDLPKSKSLATPFSVAQPIDRNPLSSGFQPFPQLDMESILGEYEAKNLFGQSATGLPTTMTRGLEQMEWKRKIANIGSKF